MMQDGEFRPDLYYRLDILRVSMLPLAERKEDIVPFMKHESNKNDLMKQMFH